MASIVAPIIARGLASAGKPLLGGAANKATSGVLGAIGSKIGGSKGKKAGKAVARGLNSVRRSLLGFQSGGKVRRAPGYAKGGRILAVHGRNNVLNSPVPAVMGYKFKK